MIARPSLLVLTAVATAVAGIANAVGLAAPDTLRAAIVSLGLWVDRYTTDVAAGRDRIDSLIDINRSIIEGLQHENIAPPSAVAPCPQGLARAAGGTDQPRP